jgi:hypothetical protein
VTDRRGLIEQLETAGREASRLEQRIRERGVPVTDSDITNCRVEVLLDKLWGPLDPDNLKAASELRALYELDYLKAISSRMREALLQLPPQAKP